MDSGDKHNDAYARRSHVDPCNITFRRNTKTLAYNRFVS